MRTHWAPMMACLSLGAAGLLTSTEGCSSSPNNAGQGGTKGSGGGAGGATSSSTGTGGGSGGSTVRGSGGSTSTSASGGISGGTTGTVPPISDSGVIPLDAPSEAVVSSPDTPPFEVNLNYKEFKPKFDPATVPGIAPIFDGTTMKGWNCGGGWKAIDGAITGDPGLGGICETTGTWDKYRLFVSMIQGGREGDGGHTGIGVVKGAAGFHGIIGPSCDWWDYDNGDRGKITGCVNLGTKETEPKTSPDQVFFHTEWFQEEFLVDVTKGTVSVALNGIHYEEHTFTPRLGGKPTPIGLKAHGGGSVRYKDIWIEANPKEPTKLLSVTK